ncbi:hypothetical protein HanPSC8_Chr08g0314581 [Helianthus annuus]|nr:hypothetical protein HanPSC8_Chr08g0314581 [Helianthus annuus]
MRCFVLYEDAIIDDGREAIGAYTTFELLTSFVSGDEEALGVYPVGGIHIRPTTTSWGVLKKYKL